MAIPENSKFVGEGYGFDDVLLVPQRSHIRSRYQGEIETTSRIAIGAPEIHIPIISANMDTVTESRMATQMALLGGLGIIHRFMSIEDQVREILQVKDRMRIIEDKPPTIHGDATINDAIDFLKRHQRGYIIIHEDNYFRGDFIGMVTERDLDSTDDMTTPLRHVMSPFNELKTVPEGTTLEQAVVLMKKKRLEKIPVINKDNKLVGVYTLKDASYYQKHPHASLDYKGRLMVGAAIGVQEGEVERALALSQAGVDILVLDIAHGELDYTEEMLKRLKIHEKITTPIIAGNVATREGTLYVRDSGADGVKVGVGPGFVCETRDVAGVGVPQITAIMNAAEAVANDSDPLPIIGDGGIRKPGDISKAIGAGADTVMIGSLLAGTDESPGEPVEQDGVMKKMVRGMASASAFEKRAALGTTTTKKEDYAPEGRTTFTPYKGKVEKIIKKFRGGLLSGMSYSNAKNISEMKKQAKFYLVRGIRDEKRTF